MRFFVLFLALLTLGACGGRAGEVLGGWESSGGSGIACFASPADAEAADRELAEKGLLSDATKEKIVTLQALEHFETADLATYDEEPRVEPRLAKAHQYIEEYAPIFRERLRLVESSIAFSGWVPVRAVAAVQDARSARPVPKLCRQVQLAVRSQRSVKGHLPEVRVEFDGWLFANKLDSLDQAMLILHEELYLLAREMGYRDSIVIRPFVAWLLSKEIHRLRPIFRSHSAAAQSFQARLGEIFGDYFLFFYRDKVNQPTVVPPAPSQYSRFVSFGKLLEVGRARKHDCLVREAKARGKEKSEDLPLDEQRKLSEQCAQEATAPHELEKLIDDEQALLLLSRWVMDPYFNILQTSENLVTWNRKDPTKTTALQASELRNACRGLALLPDNKYLGGCIQKARAYCDALPVPKD